MNAQLTLFDQAFQTSTTVNHSCKIIQFPGIAEPPKKTNYRKGEEQTVFPIKNRDQLDAMAAWLRANADRKYLLGFILGINLGLRANELLELKCSDIFFPDGTIMLILPTGFLSSKRRWINAAVSISMTLVYGPFNGIMAILSVFTLMSTSSPLVKVDISKWILCVRCSRKQPRLVESSRTSALILCARLSDTFTTKAIMTLCFFSDFSVIPVH